MSNDDHDRLIRVAANWYGLYNELFVKAQRLTDENERLRALVSWIDGAHAYNADRLEEIKRYEYEHRHQYHRHVWWLIAEVGGLRSANERLRDEIGRLQGLLEANK